MMRRTLITSGFVLAPLIACALLFLFINPGRVIVRNDSSQIATKISVAVQRNDSGQETANISVTEQRHTLQFPDLGPGQSARRWFRNTGRDGHYSLAAQLRDGTQIRADNGYITSGYFFSSAQFTITPSGHVTFIEGSH